MLGGGREAVGDSEIGTVSLHSSAKLVFTISQWKGRRYANVRKFLATDRYSGPTKSGLAMTGDILLGVIEALHKLQIEAPGVQSEEFARVSKREGTDIVISTVAPDDLKSLPSVDVREYLDTSSYTGPTKKGIRFPWEKLSEVITLLEAQAEHLASNEKIEPTLFPTVKPQWTEKIDKSKPHSGRDVILAELLPGGPKNFPDDFLDSNKIQGATIDLPTEPLMVTQQPDGKYIVRSDFGFCHPVRNATEGHFIYYAYLRGHRTVNVPQEMIVVFKAVKAYENYLRELRHSVIQAYERKSGHRPMAEHQAKNVFRHFGLPWIEQS